MLINGPSKENWQKYLISHGYKYPFLIRPGKLPVRAGAGIKGKTGP
jgi:hypothetical protein